MRDKCKVRRASVHKGTGRGLLKYLEGGLQAEDSAKAWLEGRSTFCHTENMVHFLAGLHMQQIHATMNASDWFTSPFSWILAQRLRGGGGGDGVGKIEPPGSSGEFFVMSYCPAAHWTDLNTYIL